MSQNDRVRLRAKISVCIKSKNEVFGEAHEYSLGRYDRDYPVDDVDHAADKESTMILM